MKNTVDFKRLRSSWTKYDIVKLINIAAENDLQEFISKKNTIYDSVLKSFIGINELTDAIPVYWEEIRKHLKQIRLFSLIAGITTHHEIIKMMSKFAEEGKMSGKFVYETKNDKKYTNLRSALVISGAALQNYRREATVPYNFKTLFENEQVGLLIKSLFINRLGVAGYSEEELIKDHEAFVNACDAHSMIKMLAISKDQFNKWTLGEAIISDKDKSISISDLKVYQKIPMLRVNQWMNGWDDINFDSKEFRQKPKPTFYTFSIDARLLKRLSDVHRRKTEDRTAVQRKKSDARIKEISHYIEGGFPWSTLSDEQRRSSDNDTLKMPGLLPTAIIINILSPEATRNGKTIKKEDCLTIYDVLDKQKAWEKDDQIELPTLNIPKHIFSDEWDPELKPIEVIDGQHRLWAFDDNQFFNGNYELPVIAFNNLDKAWQAYLFYTINIKPVKINTSLGFDLYPMLRTQRWLENSKDGILAYRENRAQELVETLWLSPESPWYQRINMLGEAGGPILSQAAFIRTFINSFLRKTKGLYSSELVKIEPQVLTWNRAQELVETLWLNPESPWHQRINMLGEAGGPIMSQAAFIRTFINSFLRRTKGLYSSELVKNEPQILTWNRAQQVAFIILIWDSIKEALSNSNDLIWANKIRNSKNQKSNNEEIQRDLAFEGNDSFLAKDQGVRAVMVYANDFFYTIMDESILNLNKYIWDGDLMDKNVTNELVTTALDIFKQDTQLKKYVDLFAQNIILIDWRTATADFDSDDERKKQLIYKGSGGYTEFYKAIKEKFAENSDPDLIAITSKM